MSRDKLVAMLVRFGCYNPELDHPQSQPQSNIKPRPPVVLQSISPSHPSPLPEPPLQSKVCATEDTRKSVLVVEDTKINRVSVATHRLYIDKDSLYHFGV